MTSDVVVAVAVAVAARMPCINQLEAVLVLVTKSMCLSVILLSPCCVYNNVQMLSMIPYIKENLCAITITSKTQITNPRSLSIMEPSQLFIEASDNAHTLLEINA